MKLSKEQQIEKYINQVEQLNLKEFNSQAKIKLTVENIANGFYPKLKRLIISHQKLNFLPPFKTPALKVLDCSNNNLQSIEEFAKQNYDELQELYLSYNRLKSLPKLNIKMIKKINCSNNQLQKINEFAQGFYQELEELHIIKNHLRSLPQLKMPKLNILNCSFNQISMKPVCLIDRSVQKLNHSFHFSNLQELYLFNNNIENFESLTFCDFNKIRKLYFFANKITKLHLLNKLNCPLLQFLYFHENYDFNFDLLRMGAPKLGYLQIQSYKKRRVQNIISVAKLQTKKIKKYIFVGEKLRIVQHKAIQSLERKYINLTEKIIWQVFQRN